MGAVQSSDVRNRVCYLNQDSVILFEAEGGLYDNTSTWAN